MQQRPRRAGGFFLIIALFIGAGWGVMTGHPTLGLFIGLAVGVLLAVVTWLMDRPRAPRD